MDEKEANEWKRTVRDIFDVLHFGKQSVFNDPLAKHLVEMIEARHAAYFAGRASVQPKGDVPLKHG